MNVRQASQDKHPALELITLLLYVIIGGILFTIAGTILYVLLFHSGNFNIMLQNDVLMNDINFITITQIFSSVGIFIAGSLMFAYVRKYRPKTYFHFGNKPDIQLFLMAFALMLVCLPLLEFVTSLNNKMTLPNALKDAELWMRAKEDEAAELTKRLLIMDSYSRLALNLFMIAVLPAIGEELLFRGAMQNIFTKWFYNPHIAIWVTAIIFSAIHIQFYGFFPRMFLGAMFGYLLLWSKSLWLPVFAHFLNNGTAVIMAFIFQRQGKSIDEIEQTDTFPVYGYLFSAIFTLVLLIAFYKQSRKEAEVV